MLKTKSEIKQWFDKMGVKNYTINDDLTVDVDGDVILFNKLLTEIPVQFNVVNASFYCNDNNLTSLKGCPKIVKYQFDCSHNKLTSLEYCPINVQSFYCQANELISLEHFPFVSHYLICDKNLKDSIEYKTWYLMQALKK